MPLAHHGVQFPRCSLVNIVLCIPHHLRTMHRISTIQWTRAIDLSRTPPDPAVHTTLTLPSFRLDGRTALVTGAGGGLVAAAAIGLSEAGADVILLGRTERTLEETAIAVRSNARTAHVMVCDVCDREAVRSLIGRLDSLDILVNNAGTNTPQKFVDVSDEILDGIVDLNVRSYFVVAQAAVRKMLERTDRRQRGGAVVNMSSQMGHVGASLRSVYCMSKHAIEGLTKAMAVELASTGIRVNSVCPTFTQTPLVRDLLASSDRLDEVLARIPIGRLGRVEEVAAAVVYLASPAAAMVTGASLLVDGGWTAQ